MYNWKETVVTTDMSLLEVMSVIDKEALRIALVVDAKGDLLGTLTDGDIRRALLQHGNLQIPVIEVMNKHPLTAPRTMSSIELDTFIQSKNILAVPIVDENNHLLGLHTLQSLQSGLIRENPVFIMAGGFGTRLKPLTDNCPKPMLKVGGKPILETILEGFLESGFRNFYFSTHYLPEVIQDYFGDGSQFGCSITYIHEENPLGTGGALGLLPDDLPDLPVIMINGDILTKVNYEQLLSYHAQKGGIGTMCVRQYQHQVPFGVIVSDSHDKVVDVIEKPLHCHFINAGIYVFEKELLNHVARNENINMPPLLLKCIQEGKHVNIFPIHEHWQDIGLHDELTSARQNYSALFRNNDALRYK